MTFQDAARRQYRRNSFYAVVLVAPDGTRTPIGMTQRHSGAGLMALLRSESVQAILRAIPGAESATFRKHADRLELSTGHRIVFDGTIRQAAQAQA